MPDQNTAGRRQLSDAVRKRRAELGLAMDALPEGPGEVTLRRIEVADAGGYRPKTLIQLDRSLGWRLGTAQAILDGTAGDDPDTWIQSTASRTVHDIAQANDVAEGHDSGAKGVIVPVGALAASRTAFAFIDALDQYYGDDPRATKAGRAVAEFVAQILGDEPSGD